jgi:oleate hydratase
LRLEHVLAQAAPSGKDPFGYSPGAFSEESDAMNTQSHAYLVGGGIGSLAAAFMIRDGHVPGGNITIQEAASTLGGCLDGAGHPEDGYPLRGRRMEAPINDDSTWDLYKSIPSLIHKGQTVFNETGEFNENHKMRCLTLVPVASSLWGS